MSDFGAELEAIGMVETTSQEAPANPEPTNDNPNPVEQPQAEPAQEPSKPTAETQEPSPSEALEANPDQAQDKEAEEVKPVELPDSLKPFEKHLEEMKWSAENPLELAANALKSHQEIRGLQTRTAETNKLINQKAQEAQSMVLGDINDINAVRKDAGLPEIRQAPSYGDQIKETQELYGMIAEASNSGDWTKVEQHFAGKMQDLTVSQKIAEQNPAKEYKSIVAESKASAVQNMNNAVIQNSDAKQFVDALTDQFSPGGLFDSFGVDIYKAASTPERLNQVIQLGQAVHTYQNLDKIVAEAAKIEAKKMVNANAAPSTNGQRANGQQNNGNKATKPVDGFHEMLLYSNR